eukprot:CAMPEP_0198659896 /NCGR_PEP_ID=MMETSP1467-20131203/34148_1 /TAXON_ID=1462469 /ORGANISM="unid. sp., Strain CCMP2135" /LENGTH=316 /DNA_ID=CAMNT_0044396281 /DNA_START=41 /DNA_END=991 /DNA_ORIENTATION=+
MSGETTDATSPPPRKKAKKKASVRTTTQQQGETPAPVGWRATYDLIVELRGDRTAVVDSMGSEALADETVDEDTRHYQTLISLMLSSQTKDTVTAATMAKLRAHGLSVENIQQTSDETLHELIKAVGFHNNKTRYIRDATNLLAEQHDSKVPNTLDALCQLPGVGPKMALIVLHVNCGICAGIAVDTHVHRICNQLNWVKTKQPEQTRKAIEAWMPRDIWPDVNVVLVGLGQEAQTEQAKLLRKSLAASDPSAALTLLRTLGVDANKALGKLLLEEEEDLIIDEISSLVRGGGPLSDALIRQHLPAWSDKLLGRSA